MAKKEPEKAPPLQIQRSIVLNATLTPEKLPFALRMARSGAAVSAIEIGRHPRQEATCPHCSKTMPPATLMVSRQELDNLILLLQQARDEHIPFLEKYGVEE